MKHIFMQEVSKKDEICDKDEGFNRGGTMGKVGRKK